MQVLYPPKVRFRLGQLAAHVVVALIALVVIGGATRVMEAGLACPDWPLCYGSFLPGRQMNLQVFLEWFHRLDAFFVGIVLIIQFTLSLYWAKSLLFRCFDSPSVITILSSSCSSCSRICSCSDHEWRNAKIT